MLLKKGKTAAKAKPARAASAEPKKLSVYREKVKIHQIKSKKREREKEKQLLFFCCLLLFVCCSLFLFVFVFFSLFSLGSSCSFSFCFFTSFFFLCSCFDWFPVDFDFVDLFFLICGFFLLKVAAPSRRKVQHPTKVRASLVPGAVLILLAGKFRGKRVVLLSVLPSGLLLVTGPYKLNGVPLRRVNASFVIATSTRVDLTGLKLKPEITTDAYYTAPKTAKPKRTGKDDAVFAAAKGKKVREKKEEKKKTKNP